MEMVYAPTTRKELPPFFGMAQIALSVLVKRCQKRCVEFRAMAVPFVPSFGAKAITSDWNSAVTLVSDWSVSWQVVAVPLQAPPQPKKRVPPAGEAVSVTVVPAA